MAALARLHDERAEDGGDDRDGNAVCAGKQETGTLLAGSGRGRGSVEGLIEVEAGIGRWLGPIAGLGLIGHKASMEAETGAAQSRRDCARRLRFPKGKQYSDQSAGPQSVRRIVTRRFCARPSSVALSAIGLASPMPIALMRPGATPWAAR